MIIIMLHNQKTGETRYGDENLFTEWTSNPDLSSATPNPLGSIGKDNVIKD